MKLLLKRIAKKSSYTIGRLYIDNEYFCDTLEDVDRGITQKTPLHEIQRIKKPSETSIPTGIYDITLNVISPKFSKNDFYKENADNGKLPRLINVPGFEGILIHCGNDSSHSSGCILVGKNTIVGKVTDSKNTFIKLYNRLKQAKNKISIKIE